MCIFFLVSFDSVSVFTLMIVLFAVALIVHAWCSVRCTIDWKKGKNVTVKVVKKVQKHKGRGTKRTVMKTVQNDSFFNFFAPPHGESRICTVSQKARQTDTIEHTYCVVFLTTWSSGFRAGIR